MKHNEPQYVIRVLGVEGTEIAQNKDRSPVGLYLQSYDPDAMNGLGQATFTRSPEDARGFHSPEAAATEWKRTSSVRPTREDGNPNRPLTAYSVEVVYRLT
jgi:hypothetical protein